MKEEADVAVIGAGPAGISAAIQLNRYGIKTILLEKSEPGGLLLNASLVENYPGFPEGITGRELSSLFEQQLRLNGTEICREEVLSLNRKDGIFEVLTDKRMIRSPVVIVASGTVPVQLSGCEISPYADEKIFYDLRQLRGIKCKTIAIIGAGDAAFDYAVSLSEENSVIILNRSDRVKCLPLLYSKVMNIDNISYRENINVQRIEPCPEGLVLYPGSQGFQEKEGIKVFSLVVAVGRKPSTDYISEDIMAGLNNLKDSGYIYMAGDVSNGIYRQTAIAAGDGVRAAMKIAMQMRNNQI